MLTQLRPSIPVKCPRGNGRAFAVIDYGEDHHLMWVIALDESGQIWTVSNPHVRVRSNDTLGTTCEVLGREPAQVGSAGSSP